MVKLWVSIWVATVIWVCGSFSWLTIGAVMCSQSDQWGCPEPEKFWRRVELVLSTDIILVLASAWAFQQFQTAKRTGTLQ